jgi:hypothetical protein
MLRPTRATRACGLNCGAWARFLSGRRNEMRLFKAADFADFSEVQLFQMREATKWIKLRGRIPRAEW